MKEVEDEEERSNGRNVRRSNETVRERRDELTSGCVCFVLGPPQQNPPFILST